MDENPYQSPQQQADNEAGPTPARRGLLISFCAAFAVSCAANAAILVAEWRELQHPSPPPPNVVEVVCNVPEGLLLLANLPALPLMILLAPYLPPYGDSDATTILRLGACGLLGSTTWGLMAVGASLLWRRLKHRA